MAQNILLAGGIYRNVPAIEVPGAEGGIARFLDVSDTTARPSDVAQGMIFYGADGRRLTGTASDSGASATEKDVNFYDYDGKCVYSFTLSEFLSLYSMPSVPVHSGMSDGQWNYTLDDAKSSAETFGGLNVGVSYITSSGMKIEVYATGTNIVPLFNYNAISGGAGVSWGNTFYSNSGNAWGYYSTYGGSELNNVFNQYGINYDAMLIYTGTSSTAYTHGFYVRTLQPVRIPANASKLMLTAADVHGLTGVFGLLPTSATTPYKKNGASELVCEASFKEMSSIRKNYTLDISDYAGGTYYVVINAFGEPSSSGHKNLYITSAWIE